jgi:hypothetical protein
MRSMQRSILLRRNRSVVDLCHDPLTPKQMGEADRLTVAGEVAGIALMEKAGLGVADTITWSAQRRDIV